MDTEKSLYYTNSDTLSAPVGHYSHLCRAGDFTFISGTLPVTKDGMPMTAATFEQQTHQVLENLQACLNQVGLTNSNLVQVRIYITNMDNWPLFNAIYSKWMGTAKPARAVAGVNELHYGLLLEIEATAFSPCKKA